MGWTECLVTPRPSPVGPTHGHLHSSSFTCATSLALLWSRFCLSESTFPKPLPLPFLLPSSISTLSSWTGHQWGVLSQEGAPLICFAQECVELSAGHGEALGGQAHTATHMSTTLLYPYYLQELFLCSVPRAGAALGMLAGGWPGALQIHMSLFLACPAHRRSLACSPASVRHLMIALGMDRKRLSWSQSGLAVKGPGLGSRDLGSVFRPDVCYYILLQVSCRT